MYVKFEPFLCQCLGLDVFLLQVLNEISCVYKHMLSPDVTLHSVVDIAFGQLTDELFSNCKQCVETLAEENYASLALMI